jgi:hypothetical protein
MGLSGQSGGITKGIFSQFRMPFLCPLVGVLRIVPAAMEWFKSNRGKIMSDKDAGHLLVDLQEARAEIDRLRQAILHHKWEMREYKGAFYDLNLWETIGPLPGGG